MKTKLLSMGVVLFTVAQSLAQQPAPKTLPFYEPFDYPTANVLLIENNASYGLGGHWQLFNAVVAVGSPTPVRIFESPFGNTFGLPPVIGKALKSSAGGEDPQVIFTTQTDNTTIYASALITVPTIIGAETDATWTNTTTGEFTLAFGNVNSSGTLSHTACIYIRKTSTTETKFNLGIREGSASGSAPVIWDPAVFNFGDQVFVVTKYQIDPIINPTGLATLYINPVIGDGNTEPTTNNGSTTTDIWDAATSTNTSPKTNIDRIRLQKNSAANSPRLIIDEIRVANNWKDVVTTTAYTLGLSKNEIAGLNVYPNPVTNGTVYINSDTSEAKKVSVYDVLGKQLIQKEVSNGALDVSSLNKGVYLMTVSEGTSSSTKKLIIE